MLTVTQMAQEKIREVLAAREADSTPLIRVYLRGYG